MNTVIKDKQSVCINQSINQSIALTVENGKQRNHQANIVDITMYDRQVALLQALFDEPLNLP